MINTIIPHIDWKKGEDYLPFNELKKGSEVFMKQLSLFSAIIFIITPLAFGVETVLQNGLNGYEGCEDTYLSDQNGQNKNYGDAKILSLQGYH